MISCLGAVARSRKLHSLLALFVIVAACFYSFGGRGFAVEHTRGGPHAHELSYATTAEILSTGYIVSDVQIHRCVQGVACKPPKDGASSHWERVPTKLNLFPRGRQAFNYFMYVEKSKMFDSERYVIDVSFTTKDSPPKPIVEDAEVMMHRISSDGYMWVQYVTSVMTQVPMVRDVNVLFGKRGIRDPRKHWKFNPTKIPIPGDYEIDVRMSLLKASIVQEVHILQEEKEFEGILKKNEIIASPYSKFKVMQIGDMALTDRAYHSCEGVRCTKDSETLKFVESALKEEKDVRLVIITGFTFISDEQDHPESVVLEALTPILEARIPFVYASSDGISHWENPAVKRNFNNFLASLPGCYNKKLEDLDHRIHGIANGNLKIYSIPKRPVGMYTDYNAVMSKGAAAFVTYLDSTEAMLDASQSKYLYRINHGPLAKTEQKLLFLDHPYVSQNPFSYGYDNEPLSESEFKKYLEDFRVNGYKAIAFNNPSFNKMDSSSCEWQNTEDSKVLKCLPGMAGAMWGRQNDRKREVRLFEFDFNANNLVSWRRDSVGSSDTQLIWAGQPKSDAELEAEAEKAATENIVGAGAAEETVQQEDAQNAEKVAEEESKLDGAAPEIQDEVDGADSDKLGFEESGDAEQDFDSNLAEEEVDEEADKDVDEEAEEETEELAEKVAEEMTEAENEAEGEIAKPEAK